ncbi:MAG TPA: tryptophan 7-halogenase [Kofleriaceae bacterium]|nr:tryptophan 7-halogenase [Kofleriaceae bacterium]
MSASRRGQAIVVGAGIAGITAARALADRFARVHVIERDPGVTPRPHVPHQPHTHVLGAQGYRLLCRQFAGFDEDMAASGAPRFDYGQCPYFVGRWAPRGPFGLVSRSSTRALLEAVLRRRLAACTKNVELATDQRVRGYVLGDDRVTAVRLEDGRTLEADLIVDAAGMGSKTPEWIAGHGFPTPDRTEVDLNGGVVTRLFRPAPGKADDFVIMNIRRTPGNPRHGVLSLVEGGLWRASLWGIAGTRPDKELPGFLAFARSLPVSTMAELLEDAEPVSPPYRYGNAWAQWIHYERLPRFPEGLVVIGDATFHPNYEHGQGITFCAMTADVLGAHLDHHELGARHGSSLHFQRELAATVAPWWDWNLATELTVPDVQATPAPPATPTLASRVTALRHRYFRFMRQASVHDARLWQAIIEVNQAVRSPRSLLHPEPVWRALRAGRAG